MRGNGLAAVVQSSWYDLPNHVQGIIAILDEPIAVGGGPVGATSRLPNTGAAMEFEYPRRINDTMGFQYSIIPGAPPIITLMFGVRFRI